VNAPDPKPLPGVGAGLPHESAHLHVTGRATYVDDIAVPAGTLHAALGLSSVAHGRIRVLDLSAVRAAPGVRDVIVAGAVLLSVPSAVELGTPWPALAVVGACLAWGLDNNLTRKVALTDATWLAAIKGSVAGPVNLTLGLLLGAAMPPPGPTAAAMSVGFFAYGVSLALFIVGMRHLGTARAGAYFSIAPFFGALLALALGETPTWPLVIAGALMALGVWLHLSEHHEHAHRHEPVTHTHTHVHDEHHTHDHEQPVPTGTRHSHEHTHNAVVHSHPHYPDAHHRHSH